MKDSILRLRLLPILAAFAVVTQVQVWAPIEWSTARCGIGGDFDQPFAAYGTPLPYMMWGSGSSMEYEWLPWALVANLLVLTIFAWFILRRFRFRRGALNLVWIAPVIALAMMFWNAFLVNPVPALGYGDRITLAEFRPVGIGGHRYDCTPSPYWFPKPAA